MRKYLAWAFLALLVSPAAKAGPFFDILPVPGSGTAPDVVSAFWGSSSTGGGGLTGRITFADTFVLPTSGVVSFGAGDIEEITFAHIQLPTSSGTVAPVFSFTADNSQIASASGQTILSAAFGWELLNVDVQTTVEGALFRLPGGIISGNYLVQGLVAGLNDTDATLSGFTGTALLVKSSESPGTWGFSGTTTEVAVAEPMPVLFLALSLLGIAAARIRHRR